MGLRNNTILITAGNSGIGRRLAEAFYRLENRVIQESRRRGGCRREGTPRRWEQRRGKGCFWSDERL